MRRRAPGNVPSSIRLDHGDILVMDGPAQSEYQHCTASVLQVLGLTLPTAGLHNTLRPVHQQAWWFRRLGWCPVATSVKFHIASQRVVQGFGGKNHDIQAFVVFRGHPVVCVVSWSRLWCDIFGFFGSMAVFQWTGWWSYASAVARCDVGGCLLLRLVVKSCGRSGVLRLICPILSFLVLLRRLMRCRAAVCAVASPILGEALLVFSPQMLRCWLPCSCSSLPRFLEWTCGLVGPC